MIFLGDYIYCMDYGDMLVKYKEFGVKMMVLCMLVFLEEVVGVFGVMLVDENYCINGFEEKLVNLILFFNDLMCCLVFMGNYVFDIEFLFE